MTAGRDASTPGDNDLCELGTPSAPSPQGRARTTRLDVNAAKRQAFGVKFEPTVHDADTVRAVCNGRLELTPHPEWDFEAVPVWTSDPFTDRNWCAQLHMLRWLDPLRRRADDGDQEAAHTWLRITRDWVAHHIPAAPVRGNVTWIDMVDGIRALVLCIAVPFVAEHHPGDLPWLEDAILAHGEWLSDPAHLGHSNHALHQHQGLLVCGLVLRDDAMVDEAVHRLSAAFDVAYDDQGVNVEGSIMYHLANFNWWSVARRRLEAERLPVPDRMHLLDLAPEHLAHATKPDGRFVSIGDTDGGNPRLVPHPSCRWVSSNGTDGAPPEDLIRILDAGYVFARSGWGEEERDYSEETFWSLSFGASDRVHGHHDGTSMTFSSLGHEWITDPGKYQYGVSPMRDFCLDRASHNLVSLTGATYAPDAVVECVRRSVTTDLVDLRFRDPGYDGAVVTRRVVYSVSGEYAVIIDHVSADAPCTAVLNWQCGAGVEAEITSQGFRLSAGRDRAVVLYTGTRPELSTATGLEDPMAGWVATGWKARQAAPALRMQKRGTSFRFITVLAAGFRGSEPTLETVRNVPAGEIRLRVDTGRVAEQIVITPQAARLVEYARESGDGTPAEQVSELEPIDPTSASLRRRILRDTRRARRSAWDGAEVPEVRTREAAGIARLAAEYDLRHGPDLGLRAALADLNEEWVNRDGDRTVRRERPGLVAWGADSVLPGTVPTRSVYGTTGPLPRLTEDTQITYVLGSLVLPVMVCPAPGDTLTVMFHGALDRARIRLPMYQRLRFQTSLGAGPVIAIADPTLDLARDLRLGWYLGTEELDLHASIASAIRGLSAALGTQHVVLQGGSGGGFAALQVGTRISGSHVVAMNPQTDLRRYTLRSYRAAMNVAFGRDEIADDSPLHPRISVLRRIEESSARFSVSLVMNSGDVFHEKNHAQPLRDVIAGQTRVDLENTVLDLGPGHRGLDNDQYRAVMMSAYASVGAAISTAEPAQYPG